MREREIEAAREALRAFVEQWTRLTGFPELVNPYSGAIVLAKAALADLDVRAVERESDTPHTQDHNVCRWLGSLAECREKPCRHWEE